MKRLQQLLYAQVRYHSYRPFHQRAEHQVRHGMKKSHNNKDRVIGKMLNHESGERRKERAAQSIAERGDS